jgi:hypothetical protein
MVNDLSSININNSLGVMKNSTKEFFEIRNKIHKEHFNFSNNYNETRILLNNKSNLRYYTK